MTAEKVMKIAQFICENLGKEAYIIDNIDCYECPDCETAGCPLGMTLASRIKEDACREKRVIVRRVNLDSAAIRLNKSEDTIDILIDDCYCCGPDEIFTSKEAATAYMESLPDDIQKFYSQET